MKKFMLVMVALMACLCAAAEQSDPAIEFDKTTFDFGTVRQTSDPVVLEYDFVNAGDKPLVIISAISPCGCTQASYPDSPIASGEKGTITLKFNPAHQLGEINKAVTVRTNDPKHKKVVLRLTGVVIQ